MKLYVGNLPYSFAAQDLKNLFSAYGTVVNASVVSDRDTGQSRGFGFVEMASRKEGQAAIDSLNGQQQGGRAIIVNEAKPQEKRERSDRGGNRGFGDREGGSRGDRGFGDREDRQRRPFRKGNE